MAVSMDDAFAAEDLDPFNLNPSTGVDPTRAVRNVGTAAQTIGTDPTQDVTLPLSITGAPRGVQYASLAPAEGQVVNLAAANPVNLSAPQEVAPVIPPASIARPVQTGQQPVRVAQAGGQPSVTLPGSQPLSVAPPQGGGTVPFAGKDQGPFGRDEQQPIPFNPNADPDVQKMRNLDEQIKKQSDIVNNYPLKKILYPSEIDAARKELDRLNADKSELQKKLEIKQTNIQANKNSGLSVDLGSNADNAARAEAQIGEWKDKGNFTAYRALLASGHADQAKQWNPEGFNKLGEDVTKVGAAFDLLDKATTATFKGEREKALALGAGVFNARNLGLYDGNIPKTKEEYDRKQSLIQGPFNSANDAVDQYQTAQLNRAVPQLITDEKVAGPVVKQFKHDNGDPFPNLEAVTLENGQIGGRDKPGSKNLSKWGDQGDGTPGETSDMTAEKYDQVTKMYNSEQEKGAINKYKLAQDFSKTVMRKENWTRGPGTSVIMDKTGGVFSNVAEAAQGSGKIGFTKQLEKMFGDVDNTLNTLYANSSALKAWIHSDRSTPAPTPEPRMTPEAIKGFQDIAKFELDMAKEQLGRLRGPTAFLARNGGSLSETGLDEEAQHLLQPIVNEITQRARLAKDKYPATFQGDQRIYLPIGTKGKDVTPAGTYARSINAVIDPPASAAPPVAPSGGRPAAPGALPSSTPGGGGGETTITGPNRAGNTGALTPEALAAAGRARLAPPAPPAAAGGALRPMAATPAASLIQSLGGASAAPAAPPAAAPQQVAQAQPAGSWDFRTPAPAAAPQPAAPPAFDGPSYKAGIGRGESNNNYTAPPPRNAAGVLLSTASGKYMMIDKTWNRVKPPGATAMRAMDATPAQQEAANDALILENSQVLTKAGLPVNNFTMSVAHNLGAGKKGASSLLVAPDDDIALKHVDREAAANNPQFFWQGGDGKLLTVAESKAKYAEHYNTGGAASPKPIQDMTISELHKEARERKAAGVPQRGEADKSVLGGVVQRAFTDAIPSALQTGGQIAGGAVGGPGGAVVGGAVGRAIGDPLRDYLSNDPDKQDASSLLLSGVGGGVQGGIQSLPIGGLTGAGVRTLGSAGASGLTDYAQTGDLWHAIPKAIGTGVGTAVGEVGGGLLNKAFASRLESIPIADRAAVIAAGNVIATQKPGIMDARGNTTLNPEYRQAEQLLTSKGFDPKRIAADVKNTGAGAGTTAYGPAVINRPAEAERLAAAQDIQKVVSDVGAAHAAYGSPGSTTVSINGVTTRVTLPPNMQQRAKLDADLGKAIQSPKDALITDTNLGGKIPRIVAEDAQAAHDIMFRPSTNYGQVMDNFATANTRVLDKIRKVEDIPAAAGDAYKNKTDTLEGLKAISDHIRQQQYKIIDSGLLPPDQAAALKSHLEQASIRYAKAISAGGRDIVATIAKGGQDADKARDAFVASAKNDPTAQRWMNAMVEAEKNKGSKTGDFIYMTGGIAGAIGTAAKLMPIVGTPTGAAVSLISGAVGLAKAKKLAMDYITQKGAGKIVNFDQLVRNNATPFKQNIQSGVSTLGGTAGGDAVDAWQGKPTVENRGARVPISQ